MQAAPYTAGSLQRLHTFCIVTVQPEGYSWVCVSMLRPWSLVRSVKCLACRFLFSTNTTVLPIVSGCVCLCREFETVKAQVAWHLPNLGPTLPQACSWVARHQALTVLFVQLDCPEPDLAGASCALFRQVICMACKGDMLAGERPVCRPATGSLRRP